MTFAPKILIVSLGSIGQRHLRNTITLLPTAEIAVYRQHTTPTGLIDGETGIEGVAHLYHDLDAAIAFAPDAVIIASPAHSHLAIARPFIEQSIPVFVEKPLSDTASNCDDLAALAAQKGAFVQLGYVLHFQPIKAWLRDLIHQGVVGKLHTAHIQTGQYLPDWRPDSDYRIGVSAQKKLGGGVLLELSHELDYARWFFGQPDRLFCQTDKTSDLDIDVEDTALVMFHYDAAAIARRVSIQIDFLQRVPRMTLEVIGAEGTLVADLIQEQVLVYKPGQDSPDRLKAPGMETGNEMYLRQFDLFFHHALAGYQSRFEKTAGYDQWPTLQSACSVMHLIDAARYSSNTGSIQKV